MNDPSPNKTETRMRADSKAEGQRWLAQAERDIDDATYLLEGDRYSLACFVSQQAAEKAVKAVYQKINKDVWGHSVTEMLDGLKGIFEVSENLENSAKKLDKFYILTRYVNGFDSGAPVDYYTQEDSQSALKAAGEIIEFCKDIVGE